MKKYFEEMLMRRKKNEREEENLLPDTQLENDELEKAAHRSFCAVLKQMFSIQADSASHKEIRERLLSGGRITGTNMVVMICAILIASVGLNTGSTAVIIGAMLISPLMGTILAMAYGTASADYKMLKHYGTGFAFQILCSLAASTIFFLLSPVKEPTSELIARTAPSFFDVIIASAGGIAGIVGQTNKDKANNIIPGVAIATALMPPLCTCGYAIANLNLEMLIGAAYLFLINVYFIYASACSVLAILDIPMIREVTDAQKRRFHFKMARNTIIVVLPCILLAFGIHLN